MIELYNFSSNHTSLHIVFSWRSRTLLSLTNQSRADCLASPISKRHNLTRTENYKLATQFISSIAYTNWRLIKFILMNRPGSLYQGNKSDSLNIVKINEGTQWNTLTPELFIFQISKILPSRKAAPDSSTLQYIVIDKLLVFNRSIRFKILRSP